MIYKLDHIGITVRSLADAQNQIENIHPCFHSQLGIEVREALSEVSIHKPEQLSISLHKKKNNISIELIEYPRVSEKTGSMFPWWYDSSQPPGDLKDLKDAVREQVDRSLRGYGFADIVSLLAAHEVFNAVVIPVEDLAAEERFWEELRFKKIHADDEAVILGLQSLVPPAERHYIILYRVDYAIRYHTDVEGINEIALLCNSCSADLRTFPQDVFKSAVDTLLVDGKEIDLGYLRSPSGVLAELFSVRFVANER
jgi:hypothetical protein